MKDIFIVETRISKYFVIAEDIEKAKIKFSQIYPSEKIRNIHNLEDDHEVIR